MQPGQVTGQAEAAVDRVSVGAGVDDAAGFVDPDEAVTDARGIRAVASLAGAGELAPGDHLGELAGGLQAGEFEAARSAHA